jgi:Domain of unknown function (DUF4402)
VFLRPSFALALCLAALLTAPSVHAQCLLCDKTAPGVTSNPSGSDDAPLRVEISAQLDFSRIATSTGGGSVTIDPQTGTRRLSGNLLDLGGMALSGEAVISGTPGRGVRVFVPSAIDLEGDSGRSARVVDVATDLGPAPRLGADGRLRFRFGGRLQVASDDDGNYRGRIPISVEYE